jgi:hypothetical protein
METKMKIKIPIKELGRGRVRDMLRSLSKYKYIRTYEDIRKDNDINVGEYRWYAVLNKHILNVLLSKGELLFTSYDVTDVTLDAEDNTVVIGLEVLYAN